MLDGDGIVVPRDLQCGEDLLPQPFAVTVAEGAERPGAVRDIGERRRIQYAVFADIVLEQLRILCVEIVDRLCFAQIADDFENVHPLPEKVRRVDICADDVADRRAQAQAGGGIVYAEAGMQFERDLFNAVFRSEFCRFFPIRYQDFVPLPFEHLRIIGRPCTGHPGGRLCIRVGTGAARKGDNPVHAELTREYARRLEIRLERRSRLFVRMHAVAVYRERRDAHVVFFERFDKFLARLFVLAKDERVGVRLAGIPAHAQFELVYAERGEVCQAFVQAVPAQNAAHYADFHNKTSFIRYVLPLRQFCALQLFFDYDILLRRALRRLHQAEHAQDLVLADGGISLSRAHGGKIFIESERLGMHDGQRQFLDRIPFPRSHGAGESVARPDAVLCALPGEDARDAARQIPIGDRCGAFGSVHLPAGKGAEAVGRHDDAVIDAVFEVNGNIAPVVHLLAVNVTEFAVQAFDGAWDHLQHLIDEVHAPVEQHAAALRPLFAPAAGDAVAARHARLDFIYASDDAALRELPHGQKVVVPAAVLVHFEQHARLFRRGIHLFRLGAAHRDWFFAEYVFPRLCRRVRIRRVEVVGNCQKHGADRFIRPDLLRRSVCAQTDAARRFRTGGVNVVHARDPDGERGFSLGEFP